MQTTVSLLSCGMDSDLTPRPPFYSSICRGPITHGRLFVVYPREPVEFNRGYAGKHDEDLNTYLIPASPLISIPCASAESRDVQVSLFLVASSAFIFDVQSELGADLDNTTATCMWILIYAVKGSPFRVHHALVKAAGTDRLSVSASVRRASYSTSLSRT